MTAALHIVAEVPRRGVRLDVELAAGQVHAVLGANGAGKSTLLALAAGTVRPEPGTVAVAGTTMAGPRTWVAPHRRGVGLLAQEPLLFPHLDVLANVAFGLRAQGVPRREAAVRAREGLERLGAGELAGRRPAELSGGQQQRVAIARALVPEPQLLLLDEPLAALDVAVAAQVRGLLRGALRGQGRSSIIVTHDLLDVLALADTVAVLADGRVVEQGPTTAVLARPRAPFLAELVGVNLVLGSREGSVLRSGGLVLHGMVSDAGSNGSRAAAMFSPRAVAVHRESPGGSPRNAVPVMLASIEHRGELIRLGGQVAGGPLLLADVTPAALAALGLSIGDELCFTIKAAEVTLYPA